MGVTLRTNRQSFQYWDLLAKMGFMGKIPSDKDISVAAKNSSTRLTNPGIL